MSLDWNLTGIKDYNEVCWITDDKGEKRLDGVTQTIIWATMAVGIGTITEANAPEFFARISIIEDMDGAWMIGPDGPVRFTYEDVVRHIGLKTNVFPEETRAKWIKRQVTRVMDDRVREAQRKATAVTA